MPTLYVKRRRGEVVVDAEVEAAEELLEPSREEETESTMEAVSTMAADALVDA